MRRTTAYGSAKNEGPREIPYRYEKGILTLSLHVHPGAGKSQMAGLYGESALLLRVAAPAVEGRANRDCRRFLAKALGVPVSSVTIVRGERSRRKLVRISPISTEKFQPVLAQWLS